MTFTNNQLKVKREIATHFSYEDGNFNYDNMDVTHLHVVGFFTDPTKKTDKLIRDRNVKK